MSTCSNNTVTFNIIGELQVELTIENNSFEIPLQDLFLMAARINKKRSFLFVSKVLGKHIPIKPAKGILVGSLLAARYLDVTKGESTEKLTQLFSAFKQGNDPLIQGFVPSHHNPIIIGFAETATALGHAFFEAFSNADFFHTTREFLEGVHPTITFEEEHSHATSHRAYVNSELLDSDREVILVDDELTTGKTALNIIRSIQAEHPRKSYTVVSILDWRSDENVQLFKELEIELGITIHTVSLVKGTVSVSGEFDTQSPANEEGFADSSSMNVSFYPIFIPAPISFGEGTDKTYTRFTGRFGLSAIENRQASEWLEKIGLELQKLRTGKKSLVLGAGEFMYVPMKIASFMGDGVFYHSTTRSPIYPLEKENYGAVNRFLFRSPEDPSIQNYLYNIGVNQYDEIFLFFERKVEQKNLEELLEQLKRTKTTNIKIIYFSEKEGEKNT